MNVFKRLEGAEHRLLFIRVFVAISRHKATKAVRNIKNSFLSHSFVRL